MSTFKEFGFLLLDVTLELKYLKYLSALFICVYQLQNMSKSF